MEFFPAEFVAIAVGEGLGEEACEGHFPETLSLWEGTLDFGTEDV